MIRKHQGFTLLEIFIALSIGLILIGGVLSVFVGVKTTTIETSSYGELQENGRFAISILTDDLRRQNFWGDFSGVLNTSNLNIIPPSNAANGCRGEGDNNGSFPQNIPGSFRTLWANEVTSTYIMNDCIKNAGYDSTKAGKFNSDVIQIKRAIATPIVEGNINKERFYIRSNLTSASIFAGNITTIPTLIESRIWEYQHHIYYVREDATGVSGQVVPVLVQGRLQNKATRMTFDLLIEGIERIHFMFGVDTDGDGVVNGYISSDKMQDDYWDNLNNISIVAVKLYVLARALRPDNSYSNNNVYQMGDKSFDADGDNYRRLLFSSTVSLHNARVKSW